MSAPKPVVYLLTGLPGAGKSTYARMLERKGTIRLSVDDQMASLHGLLGKDYNEHEHFALLAPVVEDVRRQLVELLRAGRSVVLDHGLGRRAERDDYKRLVTDHGGKWRLIHFRVEQVELLRRLANRNRDPEAGVISPEALAWITDHSEEPVGEGEELPDLPVGCPPPDPAT
ncbi:AAA family ATPase [Streptacidiphilus sp. N1-3]|uniref:AAA family ATPase n=1 Tax=Streptacidiphilus alkalitolerans TaxID=3342712 RepID=A0ABV6XBW1_9ACTN